MRVIGIDIGHYSIKVAEIREIARQPTLVQMGEHILSADPNKDRKIEIIDYLRGLANQFDDQTQIVLGLGQDSVALRKKHFPFKERFKIQKSLAFELEDDIPFSMVDSVFDSKTIRYVGNGADVLAVASPKDRVAAAVELANDCSLDVSQLNSTGLALANLFEDSYQTIPQVEEPDVDVPGETPAKAVLDIGHVHSNLLIFSEDRLVGLSYIDWGALHLAQDLSKKYSLHITEALKEVRNKAFILLNEEGANKDQIEFSKVVSESYLGLTQKVRLLLLEYKASRKWNTQELSLVGGGSLVKGLPGFMTQELDLKTNLVKELPHKLSLPTNFQTDNWPSCFVAIGLALDGHKKTKNPAINFLQGEFAKQSQRFVQIKEKWAYTAKLIAVMYVVMIVYGVVKDSFAESLSNETYDLLRSQARSVAGLKGSKANTRNIKGFIKDQELKEKNRRLIEQIEGVNSALDVLRKISQMTPSKSQIQLDIRNLSITEGEVAIQGLAQNKSAVALFEKQLKTMANGGKLRPYSTPIKATPGRVAFGLQFQVNRKE